MSEVVRIRRTLIIEDFPAYIDVDLDELDGVHPPLLFGRINELAHEDVRYRVELDESAVGDVMEALERRANGAELDVSGWSSSKREGG